MGENQVGHWCSWCYQKGVHYPKENNYLRRSVYECSNCKQSTLECRYCKNMARAGEKWDDECCVFLFSTGLGGCLLCFDSLGANQPALSKREYKKKSERARDMLDTLAIWISESKIDDSLPMNR